MLNTRTNIQIIVTMRNNSQLTKYTVGAESILNGKHIFYEQNVDLEVTQDF